MTRPSFMEDLEEENSKTEYHKQVHLRRLSSPVGPEWPESSVPPPFWLAGCSPDPESPQSPAPAVLWSVVPPDSDNSCLSFCLQTHQHLPEATALWS